MNSPLPGERPISSQPRCLYRHAELRPLLHPRSIAIIGASPRSGAFGERTLHNLRDFQGEVFLVNARYEEIAGQRCYKSLADLPSRPDCAISAVPMEAVATVARDCAAHAVPGLIVYASGYAETGLPERVALQAELAALLQGSATRLMGPNCTGLYNFLNEGYITFGRTPGAKVDIGRRHKIGIVSQSGAIGMALAQAVRRGVAVSHMLSPGNSADVGVADFVAYLAEEPQCQAIACAFEGIADGGMLIEALSLAVAQGKPVVLYKAGRSENGAKAALSHTGSIAGSHEAWRAACARAGAVMVDDLEAVVEMAAFLAKAGRPKTPGVVSVVTSGGAGVITADMAERHGVPMPQPDDGVLAVLKQQLPEFAALRNPCDVTAQVLNDDTPMRISAKALLDAPYYSAAIVPHPLADEIGLKRISLWNDIAAETGKIVGYVWVSEWLEGTGSRAVEEAPGLALFRSAGRCMAAIAAWQAREEHKRFAALADRDRPPAKALAQARRLLDKNGGRSLTERDSKAILAGYGVPVVPEAIAADAEEAVRIAEGFGYPVVLKLESPDVPHKTEAGVVRLDLGNADELRAACAEILARAATLPGIRVHGLLVQPMLRAGAELVIGARVDPQVGPVVLVGAGGTQVEILGDSALALAPVGRAEAEAMLRRLRCFPALNGYRNAPAADIAAIATAICRVSELIADARDRIAEIDVNPLICTGRDIRAADALIVRHVE